MIHIKTPIQLIAVIVLIIISLSAIKYYNHTIRDLQTNIEYQTKLKNALLDSVVYYENKYGEVVAEKLTLQQDIKNLEQDYSVLNFQQKELLTRIKEVEKQNTVISAALLKSLVTIDSLVANKVIVDTTNKRLNFSDKTEFVNYNIDVFRVIPSETTKKPQLVINNLSLPNEQFISFFWKDNKKEGYPVKFSVSNSNPYFKTTDINSYIIPEIKKQEIKPTGWKKFQDWFKKTNNKLTIFGSGIVVGAGSLYLLTK